ncbi:hypothetical protein Tco_1318232 [Tanacetum coccineum]
MMLLNGSKSGNGDEHQPKLSNHFKNFDYNGGGRWWLKGGDGGEMEKCAALFYKCAALGAISALGPKIKVVDNSFPDAWPLESRQTEFQLHFDISLMDALTQIPKYHKVLKDLLKDKEKLEELANTPINVECSAILLNKVPKKLGDPGKFLIPCILQDLEGVIVDFKADPRVPIILGRPFLCTAKALMDLYEEKLTLRVGNEQVVFYTDKSSRNNLRDIQSVHCINIIIFSKDKPISASTTFSSDSLPGSSFPSSTLVETSDSLLEEFDDELALLDPFPPGNENDNFDPEADLREIEYFAEPRSINRFFTYD